MNAFSHFLFIASLGVIMASCHYETYSKEKAYEQMMHDAFEGGGCNIPINVKCTEHGCPDYGDTMLLMISPFQLPLKIGKRYLPNDAWKNNLQNGIDKYGYVRISCTAYNDLKPWMVMNDAEVDSIYDRHGINGLLQTYMNGYMLDTDLPLRKRNYIRYLLYLHRMLVISIETEEWGWGDYISFYTNEEDTKQYLQVLGKNKELIK